MTLDQLIESLPLLTGIFLAVGVLFILLSSNFFRKSRRAPYWTQRRSAGQRGFRMLLVALFFMTISAIFCGMAVAYNTIDDNDRANEATKQSFTTQIPENTLVNTPTAEIEITLTEEIVPTTEVPIESTETVVESTKTVVDVTETAIESIETTVEPTGTLVDETETPAELTETAADATEASSDETQTSLGADETLTLTLDATTESPDDTPTFTPSDEPTLTLTPSDVPTETFTPSDTPSLTPTDTPTLTPTAPILTGNYPPVHPYKNKPANATLKIDGAASQISDHFVALDEGTIFSAGFPRLYFFVTSANLDNGVLWRRELLLDGNLIMARTDLWGSVVSGQNFFFFSLPDGFGVGEYEIRLYLGDTLATTYAFTVEE